MNSTNTSLLMKNISKKASKLGISAATGALTIGMLSGCSSTQNNPNTITNNSNLPPTPGDNSCRDWEWNDEYQVWECDDYNSSSHRGHAFYYGGSIFKNSSGLLSDSKYKSYKASSSFKSQRSSGNVQSSNTGVTSSKNKSNSFNSSSKSGIGSKSSGFGG